MPDRVNLECKVCGNVGLSGSVGFFYCERCGSQAEDIVDAVVDDEDYFDDGGRGGIYSASLRRTRPAPVIKAEPVSQFQSQQSELWDSTGLLGEREGDDFNVSDPVEPVEPNDFGLGSRTMTYDDYYSEIRLRYVMGMQVMIQLQCKALVEKFSVSPLIVGLVGPVWLRFVALKRVFADDWADQAIHESESQTYDSQIQTSAKHSEEPRNMLGQRAVMIWFTSLSKTIPLYYSLVVSFLVCHLAREAVLPTDILKWAVEGKLPYFSAFAEIEKEIGPPPVACPLSSSRMFRPTEALPLQKLESLTANVAQEIGLELPAVNFYAIASRFIRQLSLPVEKVLSHACRIFEWSMPPELWLSPNEFSLPTRVCVMSIIIVSVRILYNINGFGKWEMSLSSSGGSSLPAEQNGEKESVCDTDMHDDADPGISSHDVDDKGSNSQRHPASMQHSELGVVELLRNLEAKYKELAYTYEYSKDLPTYLQYCKDVVFPGLEPSADDHEEEKIIEDLWEHYQKMKNLEPLDDHGVCNLRYTSGSLKRSRDDVLRTPNERRKFRDNECASIPAEDGDVISDGDRCLRDTVNWHECSVKDPSTSSGDWPCMESYKDSAIRKLKMDMEDNRFCYIPPRLNIKRHNYLHYSRKKDEGAYTYAVHADYYLLLRSCARVVQVDPRSMHVGVLSFERKLKCLEKRIDQCLHVESPNDQTCEFCRDVAQHDTVEFMNFSNLNL